MNIIYKISPTVSDDHLNILYASAWPNHSNQTFEEELSHALFYVCAYNNSQLIGFVKVIGDGTIHGFILEPTVHPDFQRKGIGSELLAHVENHSRELGLQYLHVDFESNLLGFYRSNGYEHTEAGLLNLHASE